jgi:hypothetical protein
MSKSKQYRIYYSLHVHKSQTNLYDCYSNFYITKLQSRARSLTMAKVEFAKYTKSVPAATELITNDLVRIHS